MQQVSDVIRISIHVLRVEDDFRHCGRSFLSAVFQSTSSVWRTTSCSRLPLPEGLISIHVLRVEDDRKCPR